MAENGNRMENRSWETGSLKKNYGLAPAAKLACKHVPSTSVRWASFWTCAEALLWRIANRLNPSLRCSTTSKTTAHLGPFPQATEANGPTKFKET